MRRKTIPGRQLAIVLLALIAGALAAPARAQTWPAGPIKFIVPFPPGGAADILSRGLALKMGESLGQSIFIENRAGVAGTVGAAVLAHAAPDGYTIGLGSLSTLAINPFLSRQPLYDPRRDFAPIAMLAELPILMGVPASLPADTFDQFIAWAKQNSGKFTFSTNGVGSSSHLFGEMLKRKFGFEAAHAPYGGDVPIINAMMGEQVQLGLIAIPAAAEFVKTGKIKAPAMTGRARSPIIPDVPSIVELGYPDLVSATWFCVDAPAGVPRAIIERLNREVNKALATPEVKQVFKGAGLDANVMELAAFEDFVHAEQEKWSAEIRALDLHVD